MLPEWVFWVVGIVAVASIIGFLISSGKKAAKN